MCPTALDPLGNFFKPSFLYWCEQAGHCLDQKPRSSNGRITHTDFPTGSCVGHQSLRSLADLVERLLATLRVGDDPPAGLAGGKPVRADAGFFVQIVRI
jgi:hypothetical protein